MVRVVYLWPMTGESNILLLFLFVTQFLLALLLLDGVVESFPKLGRFLWFLFIGFQFPVDLIIVYDELFRHYGLGYCHQVTKEQICREPGSEIGRASCRERVLV